MYQHSFTDQLSRVIGVNFPPMRVVSLVPSQTELLFDLGLDNELIGLTKFCTHPAGKVKTKTKVGGTKNLNLDLIRSLRPDLIIGNKEENHRTQIETLMQEFPVWMSDIFNLHDALDMITQLGQIVNRHRQAQAMATQITQSFCTLPVSSTQLKVAYLIWKDPFMAAGTNTFINDMLSRCGWQNVVQHERYPELNLSDLNTADVILLSSEPYPFKKKHADVIAAQCPNSKILLADGEMFSWYGSRLLQAPQYFKQLLNDINNALI